MTADLTIPFPGDTSPESPGNDAPEARRNVPPVSAEDAQAIRTLCAIGGVPAMAGDFLRRGYTVERARTAIVNAKAAEDAKYNLNPSFSIGGKSLTEAQQGTPKPWADVFAKMGVLTKSAIAKAAGKSA